jgi:hypothetical protein
LELKNNSNLFINVFRHIVCSLIALTPFQFCAEFDQHRQMLDTAAIAASVAVDSLITQSLMLFGNIGRCLAARAGSHHQRRQGARLDRLGRFDSGQRFNLQLVSRYRSCRREAGYEFHDSNPGRFIALE